MQIEIREAGMYWVIIDGSWTVAEWREGLGGVMYWIWREGGIPYVNPSIGQVGVRAGSPHA